MDAKKRKLDVENAFTSSIPPIACTACVLCPIFPEVTVALAVWFGN